MRITKTVFVLFWMGLFIMAGCGNNQAESGSKGEGEKTAVETEGMAGDSIYAANKAYFDSLATVTHPIRDENNPIVTISTDYGDMTLELYRDVAPAHADSFLARTEDGFYDSLTFHRIIDNFMIQGGDPQGTGMGNAGYFLPAEFSDLPHEDGTLSMARSSSPNSASSQFFICLARNASTSRLDGQYTVFGQLLDGYDVLHRIGKVPVNRDPANPQAAPPSETVYMTDVFVSDAEGNPVN